MISTTTNMTTTTTTTTIATPVGELTLVTSPKGMRALLWKAPHDGVDEDRDDTSTLIDDVRGQLDEYFAGERRSFDLPLDPVGTAFQHEVWGVLRSIPYGTTMSYGDQARRLGDVRKARAVGAANGRNPLSIVVPCHRVVGSTGKLTGFAGGLDVKAWLLDHERGVHPLRA